jgi:hypothetical protein
VAKKDNRISKKFNPHLGSDFDDFLREVKKAYMRRSMPGPLKNCRLGS